MEAKHQPLPKHFAMKAAYEAGTRLDEIGKEHGVSKQRVHQLLLRHFGIGSNNPGRLADIYCGMHADEFKAFVSAHGFKPVRAFRQQKHNAKKRGIEWAFMLKDWFDLWLESKKWELRGISGYCMCRVGDIGPYSKDNCFIATVGENTLQGLRRMHEQKITLAGYQV
jgi:hypothetical protein